MKKDKQFTDDELQLIYAALMAYGEKLHTTAKEIPNESDALNILTNRAKDAWSLAVKVVS